MDVCLHYKSSQTKSHDVVLITERALEDFRSRVLPVFQPWFPSGSDTFLPIKPKKDAPIISWSPVQGLEGVLQRSEHSCVAAQAGTRKRKLPSSPEPGDDRWQFPSENEPKKCTRTWSVFPQKTKTPKCTQSMSRQFHKTIEKYGLHLQQRAKWTIGEMNCAPQTVEEVWSKINHNIKHARLPTCNANYRRNVEQIWVYCDLFYCEYVGHFLQQNFQLSGELTLTVHKLGDIFKL